MAVSTLKGLVEGTCEVKPIARVSVELPVPFKEAASSIGTITSDSTSALAPPVPFNLRFAEQAAAPSASTTVTNANDPVVTTVAGSSNGNADGVGEESKFSSPLGIMFNVQDSCLYVCDAANALLRRIYVQGGKVERFPDRKSDKLEIKLTKPCAIARYHKENVVYVTDQALRYVVAISVSGKMSVFAGKETSAVRFECPYGIAVDQRNGDVYVADHGENKIRKINQKGQMFPVANNASFRSPTGVCLNEKEECLYVAEEGRHMIWSIDLKLGSVRPIAGNGDLGYSDGDAHMASFNRPIGLALVEADGSLLVADCGNNRIRRIRIQKQKIAVETVAGNGQNGWRDGEFLNAQFDQPSFLCVRPSTVMCYVSDTNNNRIRKFPVL